MLSNILDNVKGEGSRKSSTTLRGVDKYKGKVLLKLNDKGKYKVDDKTRFVTLFCDKK